MARVCVVGSVNADVSYHVSALPRPGQTVLASTVSRSPGGKGGNQAVAAARAGADAALVAALGDDDAAAALRRHLVDNGVDLRGVTTVPGASGSAVIMVDSSGENCIVVDPGANSHLEVGSVDTTGAGDVFAGVLAAGWIDGHRRALRRACAAAALATLTPGAGDCAPAAHAIDELLNRRETA